MGTKGQEYFKSSLPNANDPPAIDLGETPADLIALFKGLKTEERSKFYKRRFQKLQITVRQSFLLVLQLHFSIQGSIYLRHLWFDFCTS